MPVVTPRDRLVDEIEIHATNMKEKVEYIKSIELINGINVLYICGGIGMSHEAIKHHHHVAHAFDIEIDPISRDIAKHNHGIMDHTSLPQDLRLVTDAHVDALMTAHPIDWVVMSTPCQGLSRANKRGKGLRDPRSALFNKALEVLARVRHHNPNVKHVIENVDFRRNHPGDFQDLCQRIGPAEFSDAKNMAGAARPRLFWHNLGSANAPRTKPVDANTLIAPATLAQGKTQAPCLMAAWRCTKCKSATCASPYSHAQWYEMHTHNPPMVEDGGTTRHIIPSEAEAFMDVPRGYTQWARRPDGTTYIIPDIERLKRLGAGINVRQLQHITNRPATTRPTTSETTDVVVGPPCSTVHDHVKPHTEWITGNIARWLTAGPLPIDDPSSTAWQPTWHMHGADDLIRCCTQGFGLRYEGDRSSDVEGPNGKTCQENPRITADELRKEVAKGHIAGPYTAPPLPGFKVTPRGLKEEPTKFRPISQGNMPIGNAVNDSIPKAKHVHLARTSDIDAQIRACHAATGSVWMAKADIKAAYRTMPVRPEDWHLQGIKWDGLYYIDKRMSFGCRSSVDQWLRFSDALAFTAARWGVPVLHYVDDFIFIASSEAECNEQVRRFRLICEHWGVRLKEQADCGPAQDITILGVQYDLTAMRRRIAPHRLDDLIALTTQAAQSNDRATWERLTGVLWYVSPCARAGRPHLQELSKYTNSARKSNRRPAPDDSTKRALAWWHTHLQDLADHRHDDWYGQQIIPHKRCAANATMGDAGSEWGMGGHDSHSYFKAPWPTHMWQAVQRAKGPSSLHMEALQMLVMTRLKAAEWTDSNVTCELDSLGLVRVMRNMKHQDSRMNDILKELSEWQLKHNFTLDPQWVRRCHNEAADALSKNDMDRFWANIHGDRTYLVVADEHLQPPHTHSGGMRRTEKERTRWDTRPNRKISHATPTSPTRAELCQHLVDNVTSHNRITNDPAPIMSGVNHYLRFCERIGVSDDVAPHSLRDMTSRMQMWAADAPTEYKWEGRSKRKLATGSITTYTSHIDTWWARTTGNPRKVLAAATAPHRKLITASYASGQRQVHGITHDRLSALMHGATLIKNDTARLAIKAAYSLAWYGLLTTVGIHADPSTRHLRP